MNPIQNQNLAPSGALDSQGQEVACGGVAGRARRACSSFQFQRFPRCEARNDDILEILKLFKGFDNKEAV
jgi:hypothetical protein